MKRRGEGEQGFMLVGLIMMIFLMLLVISIAAPTVARQVQREKEVETVRRGNQYVRAIRVYYRKFGHYPGSIDQLQKTNNIRFLRQKYIDPLTKKDDWRLIHVGENKTQVKGFFGQPLPGLPGAGAMGSSMGGSSPTSSSGGSSGGGFTSFGTTLLGGSSGTSAAGTSGATPAGGTAGAAGVAGTGTAAGGSGFGTTGDSGGSTGSSSTGSGFGSGTGSVGPIMGVGLEHPGESIVVVNEQTSYDTWEFLYDPRSEPKPALGNGVSTAGSTGSTSSSSGFGSPGAGTSPTSGATPGGGTSGGLNGGSLFGGSTTP